MTSIQDFYAEEHLDHSDPFGSTAGRPRAHRGFDVFRHGVGTAVPSLYAGRVTRAGWYSQALGNVVSVERADGHVFSYCHLDSIGVQVGQTIGQGDIVGGLGATGNVTGPHTHVAVNAPGAGGDPGTSPVIDPLPFIVAARNGDSGPAPAPAPSAEWDFGQQHADQARIQAALAARGRYNGPIDGVWGENSIKGIQTTCANVGYDGPIDGIPGPNTCHYVQVYAARFGDYTGPIDSVLGPNSWAGFALGLERP